MDGYLEARRPCPYANDTSTPANRCPQRLTLEQDMLAAFSFKKPDHGAGEMAQQVRGIALTPALDPGNQHGKERTAFPRHGRTHKEGRETMSILGSSHSQAGFLLRLIQETQDC